MIDYNLKINDNEPISDNLSLLLDRVCEELKKRNTKISMSCKKGWSFRCNPK